MTGQLMSRLDIPYQIWLAARRGGEVEGWRDRGGGGGA